MKDVRRGIPPTKQEARRSGKAPNEKLYQEVNTRHTNGKMKDPKSPPGKKKKQVYGKKGGVSVSPSNKRATPKAAGSKFAKTGKMPKAKPIRSIADLRQRAKERLR